MSCYRAFGLNIASEIELPELPLAPVGVSADVEVRFGKSPPSLPGGKSVDQGVSALPGAMLIDTPTARFLVRGGAKIFVEAKPGQSERDTRGYLLGSAMGAIIHQRGLLPLHANAIVVGGEAAAFAGDMGAGKSTLADFFRRRGRAVLSDDVCVVTFTADGRVLAWPGIPRIKLWDDALTAAGASADGLERVFDEQAKYSLPLSAATPVEPIPLASLYLLERGDASEPSSIRAMAGAEAFDQVRSNIYRGEYAAALGKSEVQFANLVALLKRVRVFAARRAWGFDVFRQEAEALERHVLAFRSSSSASSVSPDLAAGRRQ